MDKELEKIGNEVEAALKYMNEGTKTLGISWEEYVLSRLKQEISRHKMPENKVSE